MVSSTPRIAWQDRFSTPTAAQLRESLPSEARTVFNRVHKSLAQRHGLQEQVAWYGVCWCWSIEYRASANGAPVAVLIPSPEDLQLAMPVEQEFINLLPYRRLKRGIRDGLELARDPFDTRWAVWSLLPSTILDDLENLIDRRMRHLAAVVAR